MSWLTECHASFFEVFPSPIQHPSAMSNLVGHLWHRYRDHMNAMWWGCISTGQIVDWFWEGNPHWSQHMDADDWVYWVHDTIWRWFYTGARLEVSHVALGPLPTTHFSTHDTTLSPLDVFLIAANSVRMPAAFWKRYCYAGSCWWGYVSNTGQVVDWFWEGRVDRNSRHWCQYKDTDNMVYWFHDTTGRWFYTGVQLEVAQVALGSSPATPMTTDFTTPDTTSLRQDGCLIAVHSVPMPPALWQRYCYAGSWWWGHVSNTGQVVDWFWEDKVDRNSRHWSQHKDADDMVYWFHDTTGRWFYTGVQLEVPQVALGSLPAIPPTLISATAFASRTSGSGAVDLSDGRYGDACQRTLRWLVRSWRLQVCRVKHGRGDQSLRSVVRLWRRAILNPLVLRVLFHRWRNQVSACALCLDHLRDQEDIFETECKHRFHSACWRRYLDSRSSEPSNCPVCRQSYLGTKLRRVQASLLIQL